MMVKVLDRIFWHEKPTDLTGCCAAYYVSWQISVAAPHSNNQ